MIGDFSGMEAIGRGVKDREMIDFEMKIERRSIEARKMFEENLIDEQEFNEINKKLILECRDLYSDFEKNKVIESELDLRYGEKQENPNYIGLDLLSELAL